MLISSPEIYHLEETIRPLLYAAEHGERVLAVPQGRDDLENKYKPDDEESLKLLAVLKTQLPFLMTFPYEKFMEIGGYDEDFLGYAYEDDDLVNRFLDSGYILAPVPAHIVHLFHERFSGSEAVDKWKAGRLELNKRLFFERRGKIVRNIGIEWGKG
jgi:GT2 family glycosyltransferase